jgi:hypothetical protein
LFTAVGFVLGVDDKIMGSVGHSSSLNSEFFTGTEFDTNFQTVDGNAILNDCGTKRLPRYLTTYFLSLHLPMFTVVKLLALAKDHSKVSLDA